MPYETRYSDEAVKQLKGLRAFERVAVIDQIEKVLAVNPTLVSRVSIKRLRQPAPTQYRLRVGDVRVFYDVDGDVVLIIQILTKQDSIDFLGAAP